MSAPQGLGVWIAFRHRVGSVADAARKCVELGAQWVAPRAGDGTLNDAAFVADPAAEIAAYKATGLRVYPWLYSRPSTWRSEVEAFRRLVAAGADGILIDGEIEWANHAAEAVAYGKALRAAVGDVWVADCPWPMIGYHGDYPCAEFAAFVDARCPQVYWSEINSAGATKICATYENQWAAWESRHPSLVRPRLPIGVTYGRKEAIALGIKQLPPGECSPTEVEWFLDRYGSGASLYTVEAASSDVTSMLRAAAAARRVGPSEVPRADSSIAPLVASNQPRS